VGSRVPFTRASRPAGRRRITKCACLSRTITCQTAIDAKRVSCCWSRSNECETPHLLSAQAGRCCRSRSLGRLVALGSRPACHDTCTVLPLRREKVSLLQHRFFDQTALAEPTKAPARHLDFAHSHRARHDGIRVAPDDVRLLCASNGDVRECQHDLMDICLMTSAQCCRRVVGVSETQNRVADVRLTHCVSGLAGAHAAA
jgi:hypothetical protein